eukprot:Platyproteum_vivax@DN4620_c0_g1_i2.p1
MAQPVNYGVNPVVSPPMAPVGGSSSPTVPAGGVVPPDRRYQPKASYPYANGPSQPSQAQSLSFYAANLNQSDGGQPVVGPMGVAQQHGAMGNMAVRPPSTSPFPDLSGSINKSAAFGGQMAQQPTTDYNPADDKPLLEELGINPEHIGARMQSVQRGCIVTGNNQQCMCRC